MKRLALAVLAISIPGALFAARYDGVSTQPRRDAAAAPQRVEAAAGLAPLSQYLGTVDFTCVNADAAGSGAHILDRDNTGLGQEALRVDIFDGNDVLIYTLSYSNVLGNFAGGIGDFFYTTPPTANPLRFVLTSLAGNGLPEQIDVDVQGTCAGLPTAGSVLEVPALSATGAVILLVAFASLGWVMLRRRRVER